MAVPAAAKQENENYNDEKRGDIHLWLLKRCDFRTHHDAYAGRESEQNRSFICYLFGFGDIVQVLEDWEAAN
jgi:hypothetical protein